MGEYTYNGLGRRVIKNAGGETTVFLYDFDGNIVAESRIDGEISFEYLYMGSNRIAIADVSTGKLFYYNNNYLGTPLRIIDSDGNVVRDADYLPFGEAEVSEHASVVNNFRFSGRYYDDETGLHYNYQRYYDPRTGRYLTPDPIGLLGGINLYAYTDNNPINDTDRYGLMAPYLVNLLRKGGEKVVRKLSKKEAIRARRKGQNIVLDTKDEALRVEKAARHGDQSSIKRHKGH